MALLTYSQLSERLSVPVGTLYAWVMKNRIPYIRLSVRVVRFDEAEIDAWLAAQSSSAGRAS